ncbi:MAG: substrate-binding domain-containing protein, partial [Cyanobacteria bacterium J06598_3]
MMRANRSTLIKLCLLTALAVPVQRAASAAGPQGVTNSATANVLGMHLLVAQASSTEFTLPASLEGEGTLIIDGSSSMRSMNEALTERFQTQYEEATVESVANGTDIALERLANGEIDLAAIGRPLTQAEKDAGLKAVNIAREKIAIFVSPNSPFDGDLTFGQFGQIFRGEITDWSEISDSASGPIRFVDRPKFSDTRQAFQPYPVFQEAPFFTGANADPVGADETDAVIAALGADGVGYAIANQVMGNEAVKIVPMHQTLPDDPRYPFSQPRSYVYAGDASPAVQGFLAVATSPEGQTVVEEVRETEGAAAAQIEGPAVTATSPDGSLTALSNEDNVAVIQDADGNLVAGPLAGAGGAITALAFSEDGETLATGTNTGKVRYWGIDGEPKGEIFKPNPDGSAVTELSFEGNDKLSVAGEGRRGLWGLNGLPFGETAAAGAGAAAAGAGADGAAAGAKGGPLWWWLLPILGLLGLGAWLLGKKGRQPAITEAKRQTSPTATVPPPMTDPDSDREVSNRAQTVIKTDRVTDDSRLLETPPAPSAPLPVGTPGLDRPEVTTQLPSFESTDLESPNLEGTNLDLMSPGAIGGALGGAAALGGMAMAAGMGAETEDDDDDDYDANLDLTLDEALVDEAPVEETLVEETLVEETVATDAVEPSAFTEAVTKIE